MRLWLLSVVVLSLVSASQAQGQITFLDGIVNFFNRLNPFRPQQSSRPTSSSPSSSTPVFRPRPSVSQTGSTPAGPFETSGLSTVGDVVTFTVPAGQTAGQTGAGNVQFDQLRIEPIATPGRGNHNFEGRRYLLTWREGNNRFSWAQARDYCTSNGMRIVSLDSPLKREHILRLVRSEGIAGMWTGGRLTPDKTFLDWQNGASEPVRPGQHPWSPQGRNGRPQPDGFGTERCVAILSDFFAVSRARGIAGVPNVLMCRMASSTTISAVNIIVQPSVRFNKTEADQRLLFYLFIYWTFRNSYMGISNYYPDIRKTNHT